MDTIWYWTGWKMRTQTNKHKITFGKVFFTGVLLYLIAVLPFIIYHGGYFFYYGDYNVQQVPFYILATRAVRNGMLFWNPKVDLGSSMGGSFAFYLWGSPFFWLACLFPEKAIPYILPFLMSLKYGTALTCSFAWLRSRVKTNRAALLGALLYSFSGFSACNIVFQHFHEAIAFFPLYLLAFDDFVQKKRRIPFALMTAFMAVLNYFFFYEEVVFIIIYYFIYYAGNAGLRRRAICGTAPQACDVEEPAAQSAAAGGAAGRELAADSTAINASAVEEAAPRFGENLRAVLPEILSLLLYGALGLCLAAFFLIQVFDTVSGNTRLSDVLLGYDMLAYSEPVTPLAIIRSMFMVPDIVGRASMFASEQIRNSSLSAYLPGFALTGVIAYLRRTAGPRRRDRLRRLLLTCLVIAFVPLLNSVFSAFNSEYYARWFFMPLLFMALATAIELEEQDYGELRTGAAVCFAADLIFALIAILPSKAKDGTVAWFRIMEYPELFWVGMIFTLVQVPFVVYLIWIYPLRRQVAERAAAEQTQADAAGEEGAESAATAANAAAEKGGEMPAGGAPADGTAPANPVPDSNSLLPRRFVALTALMCLITTMGVVFNGNTLIARSGGTKWHDQLSNAPVLPVSTEPSEGGVFARAEADGSSTNYEMVWGYPTLHCFQSTVNPSIFRFYEAIGVSRTVDSKMDLSRAGARALLSGRYYLENAQISQKNSYTDKGGIKGYVYAGNSNGFNIYENTNFIPMGFTFDSYITEDEYAGIADRTLADRILTRELILSADDAETYGHLLRKGSPDLPVSDQAFADNCTARAGTACTAFSFTKNGFTATAKLDKENLVFFSVPYDKGFTAYVDGVKTPLIRADFGLMAIDVPAGEHNIEFRYFPAGMKVCIGISAVAALILAILAWKAKQTEN